MTLAEREDPPSFVRRQHNQHADKGQRHPGDQSVTHPPLHDVKLSGGPPRAQYGSAVAKR